MDAATVETWLGEDGSARYARASTKIAMQQLSTVSGIRFPLATAIRPTLPFS
jgi:hypothetical protein